MWREYTFALADLSTPVTIAAWRDAFVVIGHDYNLNRSTVFRFDPATGEATTMTELGGYVGAIITTADHLYAHVFDRAGGAWDASRLWQSSDGETFSPIDLGFAPRALCTDGTTAVVEWMTSDGGSSTMGVAKIEGAAVVPAEESFEFETYQVEPQQDQLMRCGVNTTGVVTTLRGYDQAIADLSPQSRVTPWNAGPIGIGALVMPVSPLGAWKSDIRAITWNGHEWIAVGAGGDVESAWDALVWKSADGIIWEPAITLAGGPGNQTANSIVIRNGEMLIGGFGGQQAIVWRLTA